MFCIVNQKFSFFNGEKRVDDTSKPLYQDYFINDWIWDLMSYCVLTFVIINYDILFINSLQKGPEMYPGNAPFPLAFGIPNTEPLSYSTSGLTTMDISSKFLKYIWDVHRIFSRKPIPNSEFSQFFNQCKYQLPI